MSIPEGKFNAGPKSLAIFEEEQHYIAPGTQQIGLFSKVAMDYGKGSCYYDVDGNRYLDMYAGVGVASIGHAHPKYVKMVSEQVAKVGVGSFVTENRKEFLKKLAAVTPEGLTRTQLYSGGAEAVEAAQRLAKSYTGHFEFVGTFGGFHGKTSGVLGLLADTSFKVGLGPLSPGQYSVPYAYCYRCPFKMEHPSCGLFCVEYSRNQLKMTTTNRIAAFIMEPVQGTNGNVVPPAGYVKAMADLAHEFGALFIADEMITGFGRTGTMFASQYEGIVPDIMTVGKGIACGFPVSGLISSDKIINSKPFANPSGSSSSYGGNPMAGAACRATLETIIEEKLVENSKTVGKILFDGFKNLQEKYKFIGDVRGRGLMIGVEMVEDRKTKEPLRSEACRALFDETLKRGIMSMCYSKTIRVNPPLVITKAEAEEALGKYDESFAAIAKQFGLK